MSAARHRVAEGGRTYRDCSSIYRVADDGSRVLGVLRVGPDIAADCGVLRILFAPFARTVGLDSMLCQIAVRITAGQAQLASVRWG